MWRGEHLLGDVMKSSLHFLDCDGRPSTAAGKWWLEFRKRLAAHTSASSLTAADLLVPDCDPMVPHFPAFLEACSTYPGGKERFFEERERRWGHIWHIVTRLLPQTLPKQKLVLLDIETDYSPGSDLVHELKRTSLWLFKEAVVHVSLCMHVSSYRPGIDVSFPAVLPSALGDASDRAVSYESRPLLLSFKGRWTHAIRRACFALDNGNDIRCVDSSDEREAAKRANGGRFAPVDESAIKLHVASRFSLCPRGDACYSYRMVEALSCGAIPILIGDGWVLPFSEGGLIDYREIAICVRESDEEIRQLPSRLRQISDERLRAYQQAGRRVFEAHFATLDAQAKALLTILAMSREERESGHQTTDDLAALSFEAHTTRTPAFQTRRCSRAGSFRCRVW